MNDVWYYFPANTIRYLPPRAVATGVLEGFDYMTIYMVIWDQNVIQ